MLSYPKYSRQKVVSYVGPHCFHIQGTTANPKSCHRSDRIVFIPQVQSTQSLIIDRPALFSYPRYSGPQVFSYVNRHCFDTQGTAKPKSFHRSSRINFITKIHYTQNFIISRPSCFHTQSTADRKSFHMLARIVFTFKVQPTQSLVIGRPALFSYQRYTRPKVLS